LSRDQLFLPDNFLGGWKGEKIASSCARAATRGRIREKMGKLRTKERRVFREKERERKKEDVQPKETATMPTEFLDET
jgi:hypothetical protein